jgi:hypothetical protein
MLPRSGFRFLTTWRVRKIGKEEHLTMGELENKQRRALNNVERTWETVKLNPGNMKKNHTRNMK